MQLLKCCLVAVTIFLLAPFVYGLLPPSTNSRDGIALSEAIQVLNDVREHSPISSGLAAAIDYTVARYSHIGRTAVTVRWQPAYVAGVNAPWCPGITLNKSVWGRSSFVDAELLLHEALHDYPPYFGHAHVMPLTDEFELVYNRPYNQ
jgi:hypothetical protein